MSNSILLFSAVLFLSVCQAHTRTLKTSVKVGFHNECFYIRFGFHETGSFYLGSTSHNIGKFLLIAML